MLKLLDGWKTILALLLYSAGAIYGMTNGQNATPLVDAVVKAAGEKPADQNMMAMAGNLATFALTAWAAAGRLKKAYDQYKAGAKPSEVLSTEGYVKVAIKEGVIPAGTLIRSPEDAAVVVAVEKAAEAKEEAKPGGKG